MKSDKDPWLYTLLLIFTGYLGIHRFYAGKLAWAIAYLFTGGMFGIGVLVDVVLLLANRAVDANGASITAETGAKILIILLIVLCIFHVVLFASIISVIGWQFYLWGDEYFFEEFRNEMKRGWRSDRFTFALQMSGAGYGAYA